jgi:hypothetical protein
MPSVGILAGVGSPRLWSATGDDAADVVEAPRGVGRHLSGWRGTPLGRRERAPLAPWPLGPLATSHAGGSGGRYTGSSGTSMLLARQDLTVRATMYKCAPTMYKIVLQQCIKC